MSRQLPQNNVPLLPGNSNKQPIRIPAKNRPPFLGVLLTVFMGLLACGIFTLAGAMLFPNEIRNLLGIPIPTTVTMPVSGESGVDINLASTQQALVLTQTALVQIPSNPQEQAPSITSATPYPTYTPLPTYTPGIIPIIQTSTNSPEPNLIFEDNFDSGINTAYWQTFGTWVVADGAPVVLERYTSERKFNFNAFENQGGLIFPGTAQMDNIAIEFDAKDQVSILLSFIDEYNYKVFTIYKTGIANFSFVANGVQTGIPQSRMEFGLRNPSRIRIEIHGNSLAVYTNSGNMQYDFKNLPSAVTGAIGFVMGSNPAIDNIKIYQLP